MKWEVDQMGIDEVGINPAMNYSLPQLSKSAARKIYIRAPSIYVSWADLTTIKTTNCMPASPKP